MLKQNIISYQKSSRAGTFLLLKSFVFIPGRSLEKRKFISMRKMNFPITIVAPLVIFAMFGNGNACGRGAITIKDNGYKNILVAIDDQVPEDANLVERIKKMFTDASQLLYKMSR